MTARFALLTASGLAYFVGWTALYPVLPRFVQEELGGGGFEVGLAVGSFGLTSALLRPWVGRWGDRHGRRPMVVYGQLVVAASLLGFLVVDDIASAVALRLLFGAGEAAAFTGMATAVQDIAPPERRGEAASYWSMATYGGVATGPLLGQLVYERLGYDWVWVGAAALCVVGAALGFAAPRPPAAAVRAAPGAAGRRGFLHPAARLPGLALLAAMIAYAGYVSFVALYVSDREVVSPGVVFTVYASLIVVFRLLGAKLPDRLGAARVSTFSLTALALGLTIMAAWPAAPGLFTGLVVFAAGMALNFPALLSLVVREATDDDRTHAVASISVFFDIGFGLGGTIVGAVVALSNVRWGFFAGALIALSGVLALRSLRQPSSAAAAPAAVTPG
ncbi:MAG: MFS transporter [Acidimicrobiales bacterium]